MSAKLVWQAERLFCHILPLEEQTRVVHPRILYPLSQAGVPMGETMRLWVILTCG